MPEKNVSASKPSRKAAPSKKKTVSQEKTPPAQAASSQPAKKTTQRTSKPSAPRKIGAASKSGATLNTDDVAAGESMTGPAKTGATRKPATKSAPRKTATKKTTTKRTKKTSATAAKAAPKAAPKAQAEAAAKTADEPQTPPPYTDMAKFAHYMTDINLKAREMLEGAAERHADMGRRAAEPATDPLDIAGAGQEVAAALSAHPLRLMQMQLGFWDDYTRLFTNAVEKMSGVQKDPVAQPRPGDKRFAHKAWQENPMLDFVKQSYLLLTEWVERTIETAEGVDERTKRRAYFHADQMLAAMAPTNIPALNPEVIDETLKTQGNNWLSGMKNFMDDLERGRGELAITQADLDFFKVGENIATTPGKVVYQNGMMQLIQYTPTTENVAQRPIVIFPPWINKFYILDLQPKNSFIRWLVDQGRTVFIVSWINPGPELKEKSFPDYMREGIFEALAAVERATGEEKVDTIGYCIGGTLLAVTLAYMAQIGDERISSATFFTAQTDFEEAGDLLLFVDDRQLKNLEKQIDAAGGVLEGSSMARTFNMLRPNDLIWSAFVDNYYLGKEAKKFDLLFWNADATRMTKACHLYYLKEFYKDNKLSQGELVIDDVPIDLGAVNIPIFMQAGENDHIAPFSSVYRSAKLFGGNDVQYMLAGSGHIAGVINHPDKKKYHYRTNTALPDTVAEWKQSAEHHDFSWWPYWIKWLDSHSTGQVPARVPGDAGLPVIEDAPGSYVRVKS